DGGADGGLQVAGVDVVEGDDGVAVVDDVASRLSDSRQRKSVGHGGLPFPVGIDPVGNRIDRVVSGPQPASTVPAAPTIRGMPPGFCQVPVTPESRFAPTTALTQAFRAELATVVGANQGHPRRKAYSSASRAAASRKADTSGPCRNTSRDTLGSTAVETPAK